MQLIYNNKGWKIGHLTELSDKIMAYNEKGHYLGYYWKSANTTYTSNGSRFASGNAAIALIFTSNV